MFSPKPDEVLFAYIVVALYVVSSVLIWVDNGIQRPVYYVSKSLHEAEVHYLPLEKAILVVVLGTRKLPHYFQAYTVVVLTQYQLAFSSLGLGWVSAQDQQEFEEEEGEDLQEVWTYSYP